MIRMGKLFHLESPFEEMISPAITSSPTFKSDGGLLKIFSSSAAFLHLGECKKTGGD
jgi:hypothetical protein